MESHARLPGVGTILQDALSDLQRRAEVQDTIQSMLLDIELSVTLSKELVFMEREEELKQRARASERALQEARAVEQDQLHHNRLLADELVKELWSLAIEIGTLKRWKDDHQPIVEQHDELIAKLMYAEDQIEELRSRKRAPSAQDAASVSESSALSLIVPMESGELEISATATTGEQQTPVTTTKEIEKMSSSPDDAVEPSGKTESHMSKDPGQEAFDATSTDPVAETEREVPATEPKAQENIPVVMMLSEDDEEPPGLENFDVPVLLNIFGFLNALEILNLAQVNVALFSRIDSLFGNGEPVRPNPPIPASVETRRMEPAPTIVQIPQDPYVPPEPAKSTQQPIQLAASKSDSPPSPPGRRGIFSILQNRAAAATASGPKTLAKTPRVTGKQAQPITAAMATSMEAKLSDMELSAIIMMQTRLGQREKDVVNLMKEKEDLAAKLEGTEAVKQFLIGKVREVEKTLTKSKEDEAKVTQQIASDQEVIAFLDSRVQELERNEKKLLSELKATKEDFARTKNENSKKITVLGDMLQFERERSAENEKEYRTTKKLLVKEVKNCRLQLTALQAERDGYREQNERLRKAVVNNSISHA